MRRPLALASVLGMILWCIACTDDNGPRREADSLLAMVEFGQRYEVSSAETYADGEVGYVLAFDRPIQGSEFRLPDGYSFADPDPSGPAQELEPLSVVLVGPSPGDEGRCRMSIGEALASHPELSDSAAVVEVLIQC